MITFNLKILLYFSLYFNFQFNVMFNISDILNQPIPNCLPTPTIRPHAKEEKFVDLMGFETPPVYGIALLFNINRYTFYI